MKESDMVYETLRNSIISQEEQSHNTWLYMFVLYFTLFALGWEWSNNLFLISLLVLVIFQADLNFKQYAIHRLSVYIDVFIEQKRTDIHWESLNYSEESLNQRKYMPNIFTRFVSKWSSCILGFISSSLFFNGLTKNESYDLWLIIVLTIICVILLILLIILNYVFYRPCTRTENIIKKHYDECVLKVEEDNVIKTYDSV